MWPSVFGSRPYYPMLFAPSHIDGEGWHGNCGRVPTDGPMRLASALGDDVASSLVSGRSVFRPGQLLGIPARTRG